MPDENEVVVQEEVEMNPISKLIWEVSQQPVLYDSQNPLYKDSSARQVAWQNVAREMKIPVTDCQIKWGTLRRCLANARKRQMKRQAGGSKFIKKWRYQDEMSFLLPFIDQREYEFINVCSRKRKSAKWASFDYETSSTDPLGQSQDLFISEEYEQSSELDDQQPDTKPSSENLQLFLVGKPAASSSPSADSQSRSHHSSRSQQATALISAAVADEMYIEEDEIENVPVDTEGSDSFASYSQHEHKRLSVTTGAYQKLRNLAGEIALDEIDSFFLSMSKALKKLPQVEQIHVRSQVYNLVTRAEISWLQKTSSPTTTPNPTAEG